MACPNREQLLAFHLGDLADTDIASVGAHLSECTRCEQLARQLDGLSDQILAALRRAAAPAADLSARATRGVYPALLVPSVPAPEIPGYDALELVGRGAMSLVYKARHRKLDRLVAIKCLRADGARDLGRFRSEAEAIARLQHPNIVQIFEVGERQGQPFMTLEFLDGGTLADHLNGKPQDARASAALVQTLARAVHYAHSRVILYQMLTGRVPLQGATDLETVLLVQQEEPVPPRRLQPGLPRDLETICLKCLRKESGQRYASAEALADDLAHFLAGEPIAARPTPRWERAWKWTKRRPARAALVALATVILFVGFPGVTSLWLQADYAHAQESEQRYKAEAAAVAEKQAKNTALAREAETKTVLNFVENRILAAARPKGQEGGLGRKVTLRQAVDAALRFLAKELTDQPLTEARL